jgi:sulfite reductase (ferredoxin)
MSDANSRVDETTLSEVEGIKERSKGLRGTLAEEFAADTTHLSDEARQLLKFHGSYEQEDRDQRRERKREGLEPAFAFMIRSKIPGGVLSADQYLVHDELASRFANGTLRVTTRQDIQLHGVLKQDVRGAIRALNESLVTTLGACGDVGRNVMSCPAPLPGGLRAEVFQVARRISDHLLPRTRAYAEIWLDGERVDENEPQPDPLYGDRYLPRKFKTAVAFPDDNCTDVYANDLGFLAITERGSLTGFNVLVGGGLGQTHGKEETYPRLADPLVFVSPDDVLAVSAAVIAVQRDHGNRVDRRRARLKYLIDERGLEWFRGQVEGHVGRRLASPAPLDVTGIHDHLGWHSQGDGSWFLGLFVENGRVRDTQDVQLRSALRKVIETVRPGVHLTAQQNVLLTEIPERRRSEVNRILADHGVRREMSLSIARRWSMACPALPTCPLALAESERALPSVIDAFEVELQRQGIADVPLTIRMTGCPNGCARPYTADLAFVGRSLDKYAVYAGGNLEGTRLATKYADLVRTADLVTSVRPLLERFRDERLNDERLGDFLNRVGLAVPEPVASAR